VHVAAGAAAAALHTHTEMASAALLEDVKQLAYIMQSNRGKATGHKEDVPLTHIALRLSIN
jgi:hypothetical protein